MSGYDLFLLAHPDDDLFVRPLLTSPEGGSRKVVVYLTNGRVPGPVTPAQRRIEATRALASTKVDDIAWCGIDAGIDVYALPHNIETCHSAVRAALAARGRPNRVITHAWEGGHPDHDAAHLIGLAIATEHEVLPDSRSAPYYRAPRSGPMPFLVMSPLAENGPVERRRVTAAEALGMIGAVRHYPSQLVPMIGLTPGMAAAVLTGRRLNLQRLDRSPAPVRPMQGQLLYERRNGLTFETFTDLTRTFVASHIQSSAGSRS